MTKIAIQVKNKAEFEALMQHYESKGWKHQSATTITYNSVWYIIGYEDKYERFALDYDEAMNYKTLTFHEFSQLTGVVAKVEDIIIEKNYAVFKVNSFGVFQNWSNGVYGAITADTLEEIYTAFKALNTK